MEEKFTEVGENYEDECEIVELKDEEGKVMKFYHIGTIDYKDKWYAFFQPAEEINGLEMEEVVIFEIAGEENDECLKPVEDEKLLDEVYQAFIEEMEDCDCADDCECDDEDCDCHHHEEGCDCGCHH
ncbi:MAG: DUF1292 domain-containing protein [Christensenellaceae bacterium]